MTGEEGENPRVCPECGSRLAVGKRTFNGTPVTITVCTGHPDCSYFYWSLEGGRGDPRSPELFGDLGRWAVDESLRVLRESDPAAGFAPLRHLLEGGDDRG